MPQPTPCIFPSTHFAGETVLRQSDHQLRLPQVEGGINGLHADLETTLLPFFTSLRSDRESNGNLRKRRRGADCLFRSVPVTPHKSMDAIVELGKKLAEYRAEITARAFKASLARLRGGDGPSLLGPAS